MHDRATTDGAAPILEPGADIFHKTSYAVSDLTDASIKLSTQMMKMRTAVVDSSAARMESAVTQVAVLLAQSTLLNDTLARVLAKHRVEKQGDLK